MNLKDRLKTTVKLKKIKAEKNLMTNNVDESFNSDSILKNQDVENVLSQILTCDGNVILASSVDCENTTVAQYVKSLLPSSISAETIYDVNSNIKFVKSSKIVFPNPNIKEFVKILELIQYGYKNFIFAINICQFENIIEILKALVLLNFSNLSEKNFNTLIATASPYIVYFKKNVDGMLYVSNIVQVVLDKNSLNILEIFSNSSTKIKNKNPEPKNNDVKDDVDEILLEEKVDDVADILTLDGEIIESQDEEIIIEENVLPTEKSDVEMVPKNKYKMLKEKLKRKKLQS